MKNKKKPFSIFLKKLQNGTRVYYYSCYSFDGTRKQFSCGTDDYYEALKECTRRVVDGTLVPTSRLIFTKYTKDWFIHNCCPYTQPRIDKGRKFSMSSIDNNRRILENHLIPAFGGLRLDRITLVHIENWLQDLSNKGFSANTINKYYGVLRTILTEAYRLDYIKNNPCKKVIKFKVQHKDKKLLSDTEYGVIFDKDRIREIWGDETFYYLNKLASVTGMRIGEIQAIRPEDICDTYLHIKHSWDRVYGLKSTKSGKSRVVPLSPDFIHVLRCMSYGKRFIFSGRDPFKPLSRNTINRKLSKALSVIGIDENEKRSRGLTFHSWRHYANTILRTKGIPDVVVRNIIGHTTDQMSNHYTHIDMVEYSRKLAQ